MAAKAVPRVIRPLAEPANLGAISIGIAPQGTNSKLREKKARLKQIGRACQS